MKTGPKGFLFSTASAGIKKRGRSDIALIVSEVDANIAGMFTTNKVRAAPVDICIRKIKSGRGRAVIVNSGNANACTGKQGIKDANEIISIVSGQLGLKSALTYMCSTGTIGVPLPMNKIVPALNRLTANIGASSLEDVARAIMTTDTFPKTVHKKIRIGGRTGKISAICKGAGMIAPDMATMLCFILTDIAVEQKLMESLLRDSVEKSFNRITIDGDMSTNDSVLIISNGMLGNRPLTGKSKSFESFRNALDAATYELSELIVRDAEGATKFIEVIVRGACNSHDAGKAAFAVANSNLVKTALYGNSANWGRIMAALGYSGVRLSPAKTDIFFNNVPAVKNGVSNRREKQAAKALTSKKLKIIIDLHMGRSSAKVLTSDLTEEYIRINAHYMT